MAFMMMAFMMMSFMLMSFMMMSYMYVFNPVYRTLRTRSSWVEMPPR